MQVERRQLRASDRNTALGFFLESERDRRGSRALVLGTTAGRVIAGAGHPSHARVAAAGALKLLGLATDDVLGELGSERFLVTVVQVGGQRLLLTGVGGEDHAARAEDLARILGPSVDLS